MFNCFFLLIFVFIIFFSVIFLIFVCLLCSELFHFHNFFKALCNLVSSAIAIIVIIIIKCISSHEEV